MRILFYAAYRVAYAAFHSFQTATTKTCDNCGKRYSSGAKFCPSCGYSAQYVSARSKKELQRLRREAEQAKLEDLARKEKINRRAARSAEKRRRKDLIKVRRQLRARRYCERCDREYNYEHVYCPKCGSGTRWYSDDEIECRANDTV